MDVTGCKLWCNRTFIVMKYEARSQVPLNVQMCELLCHKSYIKIMSL